jgi:hypothetical protein
VEVKARLNFVAFTEFAVREGVQLRFGKATLSRVLAFFERLQSSYENRCERILVSKKRFSSILLTTNRYLVGKSVASACMRNLSI